MTSDSRQSDANESRGSVSGESALKTTMKSLAAQVLQEIPTHEWRDNAAAAETASDEPPATMTLEQALASDSPEARSLVADHFMKSNQTPGPQRAKKLYRVDNEDPVEAYDEIDAIAVTNDRKHSLKGPHGRRVIEIHREMATAH